MLFEAPDSEAVIALCLQADDGPMEALHRAGHWATQAAMYAARRGKRPMRYSARTWNNLSMRLSGARQLLRQLGQE